MNRRIRVRFLIIISVAALSLGLFAACGIPLGLDLKGGAEMVLQVVTDDAVRGVTDRTIQSLEPDIQAVRNSIDQFTVTAPTVACSANDCPIGMSQRRPTAELLRIV